MNVILSLYGNSLVGDPDMFALVRDKCYLPISFPFPVDDRNLSVVTLHPSGLE